MVEPTARVVVARRICGGDVVRHVQAAGDFVEDFVLELGIGRGGLNSLYKPASFSNRGRITYLSQEIACRSMSPTSCFGWGFPDQPLFMVIEEDKILVVKIAV
jgi:hypothetical protein